MVCLLLLLLPLLAGIFSAFQQSHWANTNTKQVRERKTHTDTNREKEKLKAEEKLLCSCGAIESVTAAASIAELLGSFFLCTHFGSLIL